MIPSAWLQNGKTLEVKNAPTRFGPVGFRLTTDTSGRQVRVEIFPATRRAPTHIVLRLRHPEGRALGSVKVNGREHRDLDAQRNVITLAATNGTIQLTATYD